LSSAPTSEKQALLRGMVRQYPLVLKNLKLYLSNLYRLRVRKTRIVRPYSAIFYATHKCNLDCSYCTQKNPEVFSDELDTSTTVRLLHQIRREVDTILITGGEPTVRPDIVELARAAREEARFRSVLMVTNGILLGQRLGLLDHLTGLVVSLDAVTYDGSRPLSKPSVVKKVIDNLMTVKSVWPARAVTISAVIEEGNLDEMERIVDFCREHDFVFSAQTAQVGKYPNYALLRNPRYLALVEKLTEARRSQPVNGTERLLRTLLLFREFSCFPTLFPRIYPNGDVFYPCEPLRKIAGNLLEDGSLERIYARGKRLYGDIPDCKSICYLFGNVMSSFYVKDFWGFAGDTIRRA
jgi:MoaA/NifB/PqqE/SkfB family radical SAM enzyme